MSDERVLHVEMVRVRCQECLVEVASGSRTVYDPFTEERRVFPWNAYSVEHVGPGTHRLMLCLEVQRTELSGSELVR